jgi:sugar O-acyltransferase (sialic acid O-acetyltransferase NeuD family)
MSKKIIITGTGGFAKEVFTIVSALNLENNFEGFAEPDEFILKGLVPKSVLGFPVIPYSQINIDNHQLSIAIGDSIIREKIVNQFPDNTDYITLIHPNVILTRFVEIGEGSIICAGSILTIDIVLGRHSQLNLNTTVGHDCRIGDFFTTAPNTNISGECVIGNHVYFGTASSIKQRINVGNNITVGMGAVVTKNLDEPGVYIGMPAIKK